MLAARLAAALGADVAEDGGALLVQRVVPPVEIPVDRERLARLPGHPPADAPLVCLDTETTGLATAAGTLAFLVGLARWEGATFRQTQLLLPDHADEPALLAEIARWVTPDAWLVTLQRPRVRLAAHRGALPAGRPRRARACRPPGPAAVRAARVQAPHGERPAAQRGDGAARRLAGRGRRGLGDPARSTSTCCGAGRSGALAGVVIHNEKDVRSLGLLLAHVEHRYADRAARHEAPRGDLAGLARAYARDRRHDEALECLDDALAAPPPVRDPFGRTAVAPALAREAAIEERDAWWSPRVRPHFGGRAPGCRAGAATWRTGVAGRSDPRRRRRPGTRRPIAGRTSAWRRNGPARCGAWVAGPRPRRRGRPRRRPAAGSGPSPGSRSRSCASTASDDPGGRARGDPRRVAPARAAAGDRARPPAPRGGPAAARDAAGGTDRRVERGRPAPA